MRVTAFTTRVGITDRRCVCVPPRSLLIFFPILPHTVNPPLSGTVAIARSALTAYRCLIKLVCLSPAVSLCCKYYSLNFRVQIRYKLEAILFFPGRWESQKLEVIFMAKHFQVLENLSNLTGVLVRFSSRMVPNKTKGCLTI